MSCKIPRKSAILDHQKLEMKKKMKKTDNNYFHKENCYNDMWPMLALIMLNYPNALVKMQMRIRNRNILSILTKINPHERQT